MKKVFKFIGIIVLMAASAYAGYQYRDSNSRIIEDFVESKISRFIEKDNMPATEGVKNADAGEDYETARRALDTIEMNAWNYAADQNYGEFSSMFKKSDMEEGAIEDFYQVFRNATMNGYDHREVHMIAEAEGYYWGEVVHYLVTGRHPDTDQIHDTFFFTIKYQDGDWIIKTPDEKTNSKLRDHLFEKAGENYLNAYKSARNMCVFDNSLWMNPSIVYQGCLTNLLVMACQNEDGSVDAKIVIQNGTDVILKIRSLQLTIEDSQLGTVLEKQEDTSVAVAPGRSVTYTMHIDVGQVYSGTATWGQLSSHVHVVF